jgi:hypothetical protein
MFFIPLLIKTMILKKLKLIFILSVFFLSACQKDESSKTEKSQEVVNSEFKKELVIPFDSLPDSQKELQIAVVNLPRIPENVIGTREEEKYTQELINLRGKWNSNIGSLIKDWECSISDKEQTMELENVMSCSPAGMKIGYSRIRAEVSNRPDRIFLGDKFLVSGTIDTIDINSAILYNPNFPNHYAINLKNATIKYLQVK